MRTKIKLIGAITNTDRTNLSEFLGHDCLEEGQWAKFTRTDSTFEFAVCSNGQHFIRLPGYSINNVFYKMKEVKTYIEECGYVVVSGFTVLHALIAEAFLDDYVPYPEKEVNHKDGNKLKNDISNLEMVTHQENIDHFLNDSRMIEKREAWRNKHKGTNHWSEDTRKRMSERMKGFKHSEETKAKISSIHKGKKLSPEHIACIKKANSGNHNLAGRMCITNGKENHSIFPEDFASWEAKGFRRGKTVFNPPGPGTKKPYQHTPEFLEKQRLRKLSKEVTK